MLAGERAGRRNNDPSLIAPFAAALGDRNAEGAMNGHRRLAALFVMLALVGCARAARLRLFTVTRCAIKTDLASHYASTRTGRKSSSIKAVCGAPS